MEGDTVELTEDVIDAPIWPPRVCVCVVCVCVCPVQPIPIVCPVQPIPILMPLPPKGGKTTSNIIEVLVDEWELQN